MVFIQKSPNRLQFTCEYCLNRQSVQQFGAFERTLNNQRVNFSACSPKKNKSLFCLDFHQFTFRFAQASTPFGNSLHHRF